MNGQNFLYDFHKETISSHMIYFDDLFVQEKYNEALQELDVVLGLYLIIGIDSLLSQILNYYCILGQKFRYENDSDNINISYERVFLICSKVSVLSKDNKLLLLDIFNYYCDLGKVLRDENKNDESIDLYNKAMFISEKLNEPRDKAYCYNALGLTYYNEGDYISAIISYSKGIRILNAIKYPEVAMLYNNLVPSYRALGKYEKAIKYSNKALGLYKKATGKEKEISLFYNNIGCIYQVKGELSTSIDYHNKSLQMRKNLDKDSLDVAESYNNIGKVYHAKQDYFKAIDNFKESLKIYQGKRGNEYLKTSIVLHNLAESYKSINQAVVF